MQVVLVTGGFDPLHSGHIAYFKEAKKLGQYLIVGLNSDEWLTRKKGRPFMPLQERISIIEMLDIVDEVITFDDSDNTAIDAINEVKKVWGHHSIIFANGGDRTKHNIPEMLSHADVEYVFGVGGEDKKNSSSWILKEWSQPTTERVWGKYTVLDKGEGWQVKQLAFDAGKSLSDQRHFKRSEHWHVVSGAIRIDLEFQDGTKSFWYGEKGSSLDIPVNTWHKATNIGNYTARVIEVWLGNELTEDDIERRD